MVEKLHENEVQNINAAISSSAGLTEEEKELYLDLAQLSLDIVGIVDPTPITDGLNTITSLFRGKWLDAGMSAVSMVPYIGDLAKAGKLGSWVQTVESVISTAANNERFAAVVEPVLSGISNGIDNIQSVLPGNAQSTLGAIKSKIDNKGTGGSGDSIPTTSATRPDLPNNISRAQLGDLIGSGANKDVFAFGDNQVVGILKSGKSPALLDVELELLNKLDNFGLPVVNAQGPILVDGTPALLFERFSLGSKNVVRSVDGKITKVGSSPLLNQRSIDDLTLIRETMVEKNIWINDLQFLIGDDGSIVISDPLEVDTRGTSKKNKRMIKLLIQAAEENIK